MKNVCITGVAGFIGSHLAKRYLYDGWKVYGVDDFSSSTRWSSHLKELRKNQSFEFHEITIENPDAMFAQARYRKFDLILNFACPASPPRYQTIPLKTLNTCFIGTRTMLEIARQHGCRIVHASTSEIYGDPVSSPQKETDWGNVNCYGERSMYDEGKRVAESLVWTYRNTVNVDARIVRIFNTYGPQMDKNDGRVVTNFIKQAMVGEDITVYGDGTQTRSFCYVSDLVEGIVRMGASDKIINQPINLGNPIEFTVLELANKVIGLFDTDSKITFKPLPSDDPRQRKPDITNAAEVLGWKPIVSLEEGLRKMIAETTWIVR